MRTRGPLPEAHVSYRSQYTRCNKAGCQMCAHGGRGHGPYWYAYWHEGGRLRSRYLGKQPPAALTGGGHDTAQDPSPGRPPTAAGLRVRTLGAFAVWRGRKRIPAAAWSRRKAAALFKVLLSVPEHRLHRDQAIELLWPDVDAHRAASSLRFTLHQLRAILDAPGAPSSYIQSHDGTLVLVPSPGAGDAAEIRSPPGWLDATDFAQAAATALERGDVDLCEAALALYAGDFLPEERYEDWAIQRREELAQQRLALLLHRARLCAKGRGTDEAVRAWQAVIAEDPCQEEAGYALMRALAERGQPGEALRVYGALATALQGELRIAPSAAIERLRARLLAQERPAAEPHMPQAAGAGPAVQSVPLPPARADNLPVALTSFVERPAEQAAVRELLTGSRLLTLIGIGGAGKTRLALQVAGELLARDTPPRADDARPYPDGVWLVELATLVNPDLVPETVAAVFGLREAAPDRPLLASLIDVLRPKRLLLVLDNCEHLLDSTAELVGALLPACPGLRILATSRESLGVPGETVYRVPSLSVPNPDRPLPPERLLEYEAVQLFLERARAQRPAFALTPQNAQAISKICARLDGIPLAIELAAARTGALPVETIADRLDDRFRLLVVGPRTGLPRHRTLLAALDWSHDLLAEPERILLRRLAVFAGGWTLEAAEAVCSGDGVGDWEVLDLLTALVDKSLVVMEEREDGARYALQETMREYAHDKLAASGEALSQYERHFRWCLALAEDGAPALTGPRQRTWLDRLATEHDNLRAALSWSQMMEAQAEGHPAGVLRLVAALWRFWWMHGHVHEGRQWLESALAADSGGSSSVRAQALGGAGVLAADQGDYARARALHEESLAIWRSLGDAQGIAGGLNNLASVLQQQGDCARARALHEESLAIWRSLGDVQGAANALNQLACIARDNEGEYAQAAAMLEESLALRRGLGDARGIAMSLNNLGLVAFHQGQYPRATALLEEGLALRAQLGDARGVAISLGNLGRVANKQGDCQRGGALYRRSLALRWNLGDKRGLAECLDGLAAVAGAQGQCERAARLLGAAETLCRQIGIAHHPHGLPPHDLDLGALELSLGHDAFLAAWAAGQALPLDQAIAYAGEVDETEGSGR